MNTAQEPDRYEIRVKGHLPDRWDTWFDGMTLTRHTDGTTVLYGPVADQSALHGLLRKVSDLDGPDIARALSVSLNTMRTHTRNIYAKLGVTSRRAAVRQAHDLKLLPDLRRS